MNTRIERELAMVAGAPFRHFNGKEKAMKDKHRAASPKPGKASQVTVESKAHKRASDEEIRLRAYRKYCDRNGTKGDPMFDWLEAERELREATPAESRGSKNPGSPSVS
jgi:hypothetical protein